jgi:hypothetical protein
MFSADEMANRMTRRFACGHCDDRFLSQKDTDRHVSSVHMKAILFFCNFPGCLRAQKGFARKDNLDAHCRRVHTNHLVNSSNVRGRPTSEKARSATVRSQSDKNLGEYSRDELVVMVLEEREARRAELSRRLKIEREMESMRSKYEKREGVFMRF